MSKHSNNPEYEKLNEEITELTFQRCFPTHRLSQPEWEAIQQKIEDKVKQRNALVAKETLDILSQ